MSGFSYDINIKRYQNLLETSVDEAERQTIQALLAEEGAKAALPTQNELNHAAVRFSR